MRVRGSMKPISRFLADPRHGQIMSLIGLVVLGAWAFAFEMPIWRPVTAVAVALAVQLAGARLIGIPFDWRSPLISSLSLTLLLRTEGQALVALAALIAIGSKFVIRWDGRHFFNPTALAIVVVVLAFDGAWVSPGQWGAEGWAAVVAAGAGLAVTYGARRFEVPLAFLAFWSALVFGRAFWLGDPVAIPDPPAKLWRAGRLCLLHDFRPDDGALEHCGPAGLDRGSRRYRLCPAGHLDCRCQARSSAWSPWRRWCLF